MDDGPGDETEPPGRRSPHDGMSPWERDDWTPEPFEPAWPTSTGREDAAGEQPTDVRPDRGRPVDDGTTASSGTPAPAPMGEQPEPPSSAPPRGRSSRLALVGAAAAIVAFGAVLVLRDSGPGSDVGAGSITLPESDPSPSVEPVTDSTSVPSAGSSVVDGEVPVSTLITGTDVSEPLPPIPQVVDGEEPIWSFTTIPVPPPASDISVPTDVVTLNGDGILNVTEFPSGRTRSVGVAVAGTNPFMVVGDDAIVLYQGTRLVLVPDEGPVRIVDISDGVVFVQAWPGTADFIVTTPAPSASVTEQEFVLGADGRIEQLDAGPVSERLFWNRTFLPNGDLVVNAPGGVYAVDAADATTRLSDGDLIATGSAHYAIEECDARLQCGGWVVDAATGERTAASLDGVATPGFVDQSNRISPDGRSIIFRDVTRGTGIRQILDVTTGVAIDVGRADAIVFADTWAADSSGVFDERRGQLVFQLRDSAESAGIQDLGGIQAVATRPAG